MPRFTLRSGVVVNVSDEKAERLGNVLKAYQPGVEADAADGDAPEAASEPEPEPAPKPAAKRSASK